MAIVICADRNKSASVPLSVRRGGLYLGLESTRASCFWRCIMSKTYEHRCRPIEVDRNSPMGIINQGMRVLKTMSISLKEATKVERIKGYLIEVQSIFDREEA